MRLFITVDYKEGMMPYKPLGLGGGYYAPILLMRELRLTPLVLESHPVKRAGQGTWI